MGYPSRRVVGARLILAFMLALFLGLAVVAPVRAGSGQVVTGGVLVPIPPPIHCNLTGAVNATLDWATRQELPGGVDHYRFAVDPGTRGQPFVLENQGTRVGSPVTGEVAAVQAPSDLDILFYGQGFTRYATPAPGGESGIVPEWAQSALVCLASGPPTSFTYRAGG